MNANLEMSAERPKPASTSSFARAVFRPALTAVTASLAAIPSASFRRQLVGRIYDHDCELVSHTLGSRTYWPMTLDDVPFDLDPSGRVEFEDLAGVLANTSLSFGVALMTPRQLA